MDIVVYGLKAGSHFLEDIQMDVPHNQQVVIPAEKAHRSKDLWRAISQRLLFQLKTNPSVPGFSQPSNEEQLKDRIAQLEVENQVLQAKLELQRVAIAQQAEIQRVYATQQEKLDTVIGMLSSGTLNVGMIAAPTTGSSNPLVRDIPQFIPTNITPEEVDTRIDTKEEESQNTSVSGASTRLREMRNRKP